MNSESIKFINIYLTEKPSITLESNWIVLFVLFLLVLGFKIFTRILLKKPNWCEMQVEISGNPKLIYKVERNNENLFIANRIHIELTTRKAALLIDEKNDLIVEVYDSWYNLFSIIREEIKSVPGNYLINHDPTTALIGLTKKILNEALRPHLTKYQAKFRKWLEDAENNPENEYLTPQELQCKYPDFVELVSSMKEVNLVLIEYSRELEKLIKGK